MESQTTQDNGGTMTVESPRFLSRRQLAHRWSVTVKAIIKWELQGLIRATRFGSAVRYGVDEIERFEQAGAAVN